MVQVYFKFASSQVQIFSKIFGHSEGDNNSTKMGKERTVLDSNDLPFEGD